jgi:hypothetical protein
MHNFDPLYEATKAHFGLMLKRYGAPVYIVNLVKQQVKDKYYHCTSPGRVLICILVCNWTCSHASSAAVPKTGQFALL